MQFETYMEIKIKMKNALFNKGLLVVLLVFGCFVTTYAQQSKQDKNEQEKARIQNLINSKNYVFVAQQALPLGGRTINLTTTYSLRLTGDTLVSDLPYFGRAF